MNGTPTKHTLFELLTDYIDYIEELGKSTAPVISALVRIAAPSLGGISIKSSRATPIEIDNAMLLFKEVPAESVFMLMDKVEALFDAKGIPADKRYSDRSRIRGLVDWTISNNMVTLPVLESSSSQEQESEPLRPVNPKYRSPNGTRQANRRQFRVRGKSHKQPFALGRKSFNDFVIIDGKEVLANPVFQAQIDGLREYQAQALEQRPPSSEKERDHTFAFFGWLHRYKGMALEDLNFEVITSPFDLYPKLENCLNEQGKPDLMVQVMKKQVATEKAKEAAKETEKLFKEFLDFMDGSVASNCAYTTVILNIIKYQYRDITDPDEFDNFEDIPAIKRFRRLRREFDGKKKKGTPVVPKEKKSLSWEEILKVVEELRVEADAEFDTGYQQDGKYYKVRRKPRWIAKKLQKFLQIVFLCVVPPDRSRTIQELEEGTSLRLGIVAGGNFRPIEQLEDPSLATWWVHLLPEGYKTGDTHGESWIPLPNVEFADGKRLYAYIDSWRIKYRSELKPKHNRFFTRHNGTTVTAQSFWETCTSIFGRHTGVPVSPKELRPSLVTYANAVGVSDSVRRSIAVAMHHTERMQESAYNMLDQVNKVNPAVQFTSDILETTIGKKRPPTGQN